jgi:hypothetical protein
MVKAEGKWPKNINKWRVVCRTMSSKAIYVTQFKRGWWIFEEWLDVGSAHTSADSADSWIKYQCSQNSVPTEAVIITYQRP